MKTKTLAAIDIGTNTFRLLIATVHHDSHKNNFIIKEIHSERIITRLGEGIPENGLLKKASIDMSIKTLKKFSEIISSYNVYKTTAVSTSALRDAENSDDFLRKAKKTTGLDIEIVTGEEEAKITAYGMLIDIALPKASLMVDIGGGSTELIFMKPAVISPHPLNQLEPTLMHSLKLGVVYLAGTYMKNDPPLNNDLNRMGEEISRTIMPSFKPFKELFTSDTVFIGTAGTVTALAAIAQHLTKYEHDKIHNFKLTLKNVKRIFSTISTITSKQRAEYLPFEPARLDIIVPGTLILLKLMEVFDFHEITVSNYGLREGILIELYKKINPKKCI